MKTITREINRMEYMSMMSQCLNMMDSCSIMMEKCGYQEMMPSMILSRETMMKSMNKINDMSMMKSGIEMMMDCLGRMCDTMISVSSQLNCNMDGMALMMSQIENMKVQMNMMQCMRMFQQICMTKLDLEMLIREGKNDAMMMKCMDMMNCCIMLNQCMMIIFQCMKMSEEMKMPVIIDMDMARMGMNEIRMAEMEMPGLMALKNEYGKMKPLKGMQIACSMHITVQTAVMLSAMMAMGAEVRCCAVNVNSTNECAAAAMNMVMGIPVFGCKGMDMDDMILGMEMCMFMDEQMSKPVNMMMDTGGMMTRMMMAKHPDSMNQMEGICMDSIMGMQMMHKMMQESKLMMPVMNLNTSPRKARIDYKYGSMESLVTSLRNLTGMMIAGKVCVVAGYGDMGKACADAMKMAGSRVIVTEIDPFCALQACMDGCMVMKMEDACKMADIIVTATENRDVITGSHFRMMKNNCVVCNMSDYDSEIDLEWLNKYYGEGKINMKPMVDMYTVDGKNILVLGEGKAVNMASSMGYSSFVMSACFTIQLMALVEFYLNSKMYEKKIYKMPVGLGAKAAKMHLQQLGIELDTLTPAQEACMMEMQMFMPEAMI